MRARIIALVVAVIVAVGIGSFVARHHSDPARTALPAVATAPATVAYTPRTGPKGTKILTEAVDPLSVAVPKDWKAPAPDALTLPQELTAFAEEAPAFGGLLQAQTQAAVRSGVRLFSYRAAPPFAFISVISFSSPAAVALTPQNVAAIVAAGRKKPSKVGLSGAQLPIGAVLKVDTSAQRGKQHVQVEVLTFISGGRTILIQMASEVTAAGIPPLFDQLAQSLNQK